MLHPKPFTQQELLKITGALVKFSAMGDSIPASELGFAGIETELGPNFLNRDIHRMKRWKVVQQTVGIDKIFAQDQNGVGIENLRRVLENWSTVPFPELLALKIGKYWLNEGHHRIALQYLAGRRQIEADVEYTR